MGFLFLAKLLLLTTRRVRDGALLVCKLSRDVHNCSRDSVGGQVVLDGQMSLAPFAHGCIRRQNQHSDSRAYDDNERDHERNPPCLVWGQTTFVNKRVEDGWHQEISDTTTGVSDPSGESICGTDDVLVEESC